LLVINVYCVFVGNTLEKIPLSYHYHFIGMYSWEQTVFFCFLKNVITYFIFGRYAFWKLSYLFVRISYPSQGILHLAVRLLYLAVRLSCLTIEVLHLAVRLSYLK